MADQTQRRRAAAGADEEERGPTRRVVLRRERVLVLPDDFDPAAVKQADEKELRKLIGGKVGEAWVVVGEFEGHSKEDAIEAHAGKPNTAEAKPGAYKAPPARGWAGGRLYERPPAPKVEARALD